MKIVIINGSARKGNTLTAINAFIKGASEKNEIEIIEPDKLNIAPCKGCGVCQCSKGCVDKDDTNPTIDKIAAADMILFATPVYWWGMSAQLKLIIDKCYCRGLQLKNKKVCTDDMLDDKLLTPLKNGHLMIRPRIKDAAKELCEQLAEIYMAKNDEKKLEIAVQIKTKIILLQFILHMWENGFIIENDKSGRNTVEKEMISYIQQSFTGEISLKEFGEQFHLSEKYVSQYFKEHFHITLSKYVTYLRLEHAKQLLQNSDIPVTEVAMLSGYQNVSYFIRSFKKTYGVSPLKYRKNEPSTWI